MLTQEEVRKRLKFHCVHGHNGLSHKNCFDQSRGEVERLGFLDIETTNLSSDFGCILCYVIEAENGTQISRCMTPQEIKEGVYDKPLLKKLCKDIRQYTRIITYYGSRFDIPYIRSRSLLHRLPFPKYGEIHHTDAYMVVKHKLGTIHSRRLGVVAPFYNIAAKGHPLNPTIWLRCLSGNQGALNFVLTHCMEDTTALRKLWQRIQPYTRLTKTSL